MSRKTENCYYHVFKTINDTIFNLECESMMTDYEKAMRNGFKRVVQSAVLYGCWFHFAQAIKKKGSQISGFFKAVRKNKQLEKLYYKFLCIPLLPPENIVNAFEMLRDIAQQLDPEVFNEFLKYFEKQWINKVSRFSNFSPLTLTRINVYTKVIVYSNMRVDIFIYQI